jgi:hypothetical protein
VLSIHRQGGPIVALSAGASARRTAPVATSAIHRVTMLSAVTVNAMRFESCDHCGTPMRAPGGVSMRRSREALLADAIARSRSPVPVTSRD